MIAKAKQIGITLMVLCGLAEYKPSFKQIMREDEYDG